MNHLLLASTKAFSAWLESRLPQLGDEWWERFVIQRLTFQQQRATEERRITTLSGLDLAALLRVIDQNWYELGQLVPLPRDARNWLKELQGVRNRWAHSPSEGLNPGDLFRDADTLARMLDVIGASVSLQQDVADFKSSAAAALAPSPQPQVPPFLAPEPAKAEAHAIKHRYAAGELVCLRSNPSAVFPILEVLPAATGETRYRVFENNVRQVYYESQLAALEEAAPQLTRSHSDLSAYMTALQLTSPAAASLLSLNAGRVRFIPYQYRPVFKLIRADRPRLLIADEVGVGKTIEAGLILKELQARNEIKSVLIICPKALVAERKWEVEMKRFDEHFTPLDGALLRHCIRETHLSGEWPMKYEKALLPFSLFDSDTLFGKPGNGKSRDPGLLELDPPPKFDLVIVDEAHHIRNSETYLHQAVRYFCDNAEAVVFLSATPVQLGREDLYTLLNVLRPDVVIDPASFNQMAEPNQFINEAIQACRRDAANWRDDVRQALRSVAATDWGRNVLAVNPGFQHIYDGLQHDTGDGTTRIRAIHALEELYTFSTLINRTRRRDIGEFTKRKPETMSTEFTLSQKTLHDDLLDIVARILARMHGNQNVRFMMTTVSRQAASSLYGLAPLLKDMLSGKLDRLEAAEANDDDEPSDYGFVSEIGAEIRGLIERAEQLDNKDPKADAFMQVVVDKLAMQKNKILVFSTFRHTLAYLKRRLEMAGVRFGLVHGGIPDDERAVLRARFALAKEDEHAIDVLLSSEVGCEGLDFQFCDCLVNYDLPWNPMRIEQRIGRIDRYGQASETIAIFNFITPGTIDADIYTRCLVRIGVFHHAIGASEEILGTITREVRNIADRFSLNDEERNEQLQQLSDNKIRQIEEEQRLEERQGELFGLNLATASWEHALQRSRNFWLEPEALTVAVGAYLSRKLNKEQEYLLGEKELKTLRLGQEARFALLDDFRKLPKSGDPLYRSWERWLKGTSPTLLVTFDQNVAVDNPTAVLLSLGHPLLRQTANYLQEPQAIAVALEVCTTELPEGTHPFAIYRWQRHGIRQGEELVGIASDPSLSERLLEMLQGASEAQSRDIPTQAVFDELDAVHHSRWLVASAEHAEDNRQLGAIRIQSLTASQQARRQLLQSQINSATNDKIRIMKRAELDRAEANFDHRIDELRRAAESGDIKAMPVVLGILHVTLPRA